MVLRQIRTHMTVILSIVGLLFMITGCSHPSSGPVAVLAAGGAKPAMDEICQAFRNLNDIEVEVSYGGGGEMLSKMLISQQGDVYIAPEQSFMDTAMEKGAVDPNTISSVAYMIPVIAVAKGNPKNIQSLSDLAKPGVRIAITRSETTLLGRLAPEIFQKAGLAKEIEANIVTQASDPNNLMTIIIMGGVDAGITWNFYQTSASDKLDFIFLSPDQITGIGEMQAAVSTYSIDIKAAKSFIQFLVSEQGQSIFRKYGYITDKQEVDKYWKQSLS